MPPDSRDTMSLAPRFHSTATIVLILTLCALSGCGKNSAPLSTSKNSAKSGADPSAQQVAPDTLVESAVQVLQSSKRSQEAHHIAAQRLNQYLARAQASGESPIGQLSADVKNALTGRLSAQQIQLIEGKQFDRPDAIHLERCFLLRDTVRQITAGKRDKTSKALAIFDWVIRNVQLISAEESASVPLPPPITILLGRGNPSERAWVFMELLRQAEIDSVLLAHLDKSPDGKQTVITPWLPAAVWDDSLYLFDTTLGLPVPGPDDQPIATIQQVIADPSLLDQLSPDSEHPYPVRPESMKSILVFLESTPQYWAPRMRFLQDSLTGENHAVLWSDLVGLAEQVRRATSEETSQELWPLPKATSERNFTKEYSEAILGNRENPIGPLTPYQFLPCAEARTAHLQGRWADAIPIYMANRVQFEQWVSHEKNQMGMRAIVANAMGAEASRPDAGKVAQQIAAKVAAQAGDLYSSIREDSTYFLGVAKFEQQDYKASTNWMAKSYLEKYPEGRWAASARYHLGRCAEAQGDTAKAIEYYTMTDKSLQAAGNRVRARRLGWDPAATTAAPSSPTETAP
jgi:hypothetical protein